MTNASINKNMLFANRLLRKMIEEWSLAPNKTFISVYKTFSAKNLSKLFISREQNSGISEKEVERLFLKGMLRINVASVSSQIFSYAYENVFKNYNQFSQSEKSKISALKATILNGQNLNNDQLLKLIRQAIAHNNDLAADPNFMFNVYDEKFTYHLKDGESRITISTTDLLKLVSLYLNNVQTLAYEDYQIEVYLNKLKQKNILHLRKKSTNKIIQPDKWQQIAIEFLSDEVKRGTLDQDSRILLQYPFKAGALANLINSIDFQTILHNITNKRMLTFEEFMLMLKTNKRKSLNKFEQFIIIGDMLALFDANALFQIFSTSTTDGMQDKLNKIKKGLDVNKIRNSIMHSTYFYDRDSHIVFYDAKVKKEEELEFVGALSFKEIELFIYSFLEYKISKIAAQDGKEAVD